MNKAQRERKRRLRADWHGSFHFHGLSYPMWLEKQLDRVTDERHYLNTVCYNDQRRFEAFEQYILDFETGMRVVERCARGTFDCTTTIPSLKKEDAVEAVVSAIVSLYHLLDDAKKRFRQLSDVELEAIKKHNEAIAKQYGYKQKRDAT